MLNLIKETLLIVKPVFSFKAKMKANFGLYL